jgi:hypothetical protein
MAPAVLASPAVTARKIKMEMMTTTMTRRMMTKS